MSSANNQSEYRKGAAPPSLFQFMAKRPADGAAPAAQPPQSPALGDPEEQAAKRRRTDEAQAASTKTAMAKVPTPAKPKPTSLGDAAQEKLQTSEIWQQEMDVNRDKEELERKKAEKARKAWVEASRDGQVEDTAAGSSSGPATGAASSSSSGSGATGANLEAAPAKPKKKMHEHDLPTSLFAASRQPGNSFYNKICYFHATAIEHHQWPWWLVPKHICDSKKRRPDHPDYDQTTLFVPEFQKSDEKDEDLKKWVTPMMKQYWKIKAKNFDKVLLFKVGKFYEVFFYDAYLAQNICDFKWMGKDPRPHVGFPEPALHPNAKKLVEAGVCSVVVEQIETVEQAQRKHAEGKKQGTVTGSTVTVDRGACEVFTPGTLLHDDMLKGGHNANYLCVLRQDGVSDLNFGVCLIDVATGQYRVGYLSEKSEDRNQLRTLLSQTQPAEVVFSAKNVAPSVIKMLKNMPVKPTCIPYEPVGDKVDTMAAAKAIVDAENKKLGEENKLPMDVEDVLLNEASMIALAVSFKYLDFVLLKQNVLPVARWETYDSSTVSKKFMILDATALDNLEILRRSDGKYDGSLLSHLDKTSTAFGYRLLRKWLVSPLLLPKDIAQRQDVVDLLLHNTKACDFTRKELKKLPDMERLFTKLCSLGATLQERRAVLYQDFIGKRITEFFGLLDAFTACQKIVQTLRKDLLANEKQQARKSGGADSGEDVLPGDEDPTAPALRPVAATLFHKLLTFQKDGGTFPDLQQQNDDFQTNYVDVNNDNPKQISYKPKTGKSAAYDQLVVAKEKIEGELDAELKQLQRHFPKAEMKYIHRLPAYRYEIEVGESELPTSFSQNPQKCMQTSSRKGFIRFHTPKIVEALKRLDEADNQLRDAMYPYAANMFLQFHKYKKHYSAALQCVAEVDVFISMAQVSAWSPNGELTRPVFVEVKNEEKDLPVLDLRDARHPVQEAQQKGFVPNDTCIPGKPSILLVTGPNMGGKSTILRQAALAVILAQVGFRVPASSLRLTPVDRIFTRVGAQDSLIEGKSTFLMELEECGTILREASRFSLAVIDELGRGTSTFDGAAIALAVLDLEHLAYYTFDGAAIALAVLEHLASAIKCRTLFATHYHLLGTHQSEEIVPFYMDVDTQGSGGVVFLYKLVKGLCPDSHGRNVAKLAGLPDSVVADAAAKSEEWGKEHESQGPELLLQQIVSLAEKGDKEGLGSLFENRKEWARCL
eukprot:g5555.t1